MEQLKLQKNQNKQQKLRARSFYRKKKEAEMLKKNCSIL